jgi:magnesium chelatase accessory protein
MRSAVLLLHGTGASAHSWRTLAPLLAARHDVIAPDLPGHGFTRAEGRRPLTLPAMAQALAALLRVLGVRPRWIIGHSAGAAIAAQMCLQGDAAHGSPGTRAAATPGATTPEPAAP